MKGFVLSSDVPEAVIAPEWAIALTKCVRRLEAWWGGHPRMTTGPAEVKWSPDVGVTLGDPDFAVVRVVRELANAPGDLAYHTRDAQGRPLCLMSLTAVLAQGATLTGPGGLTAAMAHEMLETLINWTCRQTVKGFNGCLNPDGLDEPLEVCDRAQGSDYCEPGSPDIYVANAVGPRFWIPGQRGALDIASDVGAGAVTSAFQQLPGGYHEAIAADGTRTQHFGDQVSAAVRERVLRQGPRGGAVWSATTMPTP